MSNLNLTLKGKWFDMILSGEKKEEYREVKDYWETRLIVPHESEDGEFEPHFVLFKEFNTITFTHGYAKNARKMIVECKGIDIGSARPEWSDNWQVDVFIIKLGNIIKTENI